MTSKLIRTQDITPPCDKTFIIWVNDKPLSAIQGESVLSALLASNYKSLMKNDHAICNGAYCGMGVCHNCYVQVNSQYKKRACQTIVQAGMKIKTLSNRFDNAQND
ncbi:(2Fe-2S)-binding protein [Piscirickettsia litoralis]|uniref:(2Fe-2S)-binding protein n=1 Tax=Piscirickettsia litoralis TaxID=1891921 RepID=A0ABX3A1V1_9GAMM|nr:(2Fe-2S)-binding protein [Piscirickettsia litoralis]ODN42423.1 (2Fe-2S)-binding protein [Piscirickettsia litoralis]